MYVAPLLYFRNVALNTRDFFFSEEFRFEERGYRPENSEKNVCEEP